MALLPPIDQLRFTDIESLIADETPEGPQLDYKECLDISKRSGKEKLCKFISGFANAAGGWLLYGLRESRDDENNASGLPGEIVDPCPGKNADDIIKDVSNTLREGIAPRVDFKADVVLESGGQRRVLVIHVPRSYRAPHVVNYPGRRFYVRSSRSTEPMDIDQIRSAFTASERLSERVRNWRLQRVGRVVGGETPVGLYGRHGIVLLHVVPLDALALSLLDQGAMRSEARHLKPPGFTTGNLGRLINLDGVCWHDEPAPEAGAGGYVLLFRQGMIEFADSEPLSVQYEDGRGKLLLDYVAARTVDALGMAARQFDALEMNGQVLIALSLLKVAGYQYGGDYGRRGRPIDRDHLLLPGVLVEQPDELNLPATFRPVFDALWQSAGLRECPHFSPEGEWHRPKDV